MKIFRKMTILFLLAALAAGVLGPAALAEGSGAPMPEPTLVPMGTMEEQTAPDTTEETAAPETTPEPSATAEPAAEEQTADTAPAAQQDGGACVWQEPGNTVADILDGGTQLKDGDELYYSDNGVWKDAGGGTAYLTADDARNLNLSGDWLYYTADNEVRRIPRDGGASETVYVFGSTIKQLYVIGSELRFLADGAAYSYDQNGQTLTALAGPSEAMGLIPTEYGNLFLAGTVCDYDLYAGETLLLSGVKCAYTDSGYLVLTDGEGTWQASLSGIFDGAFSREAYSLHTADAAADETGLSDDAQLQNEAAFLDSAAYEELQELLTPASDGASYYTESNAGIAWLASNGALSADQQNIILRARQMAEVQWTPLYDRYSWGGNDAAYVSSNSSRNSKVEATDGSYTLGYFQAGKTYQGVPYAQAVWTGYVGWKLSLADFVNAVNNGSSEFYSGYSTYSKTAPYYGSDCSGFVSWAWDLPVRCTCTSMVPYSSYIGTSLSSLQVGDCLNNTAAHVTLVTDIGYNASGEIVSVEITEQTPCKMRVTCYGELIPGRTYHYTGSLTSLKNNYLNSGYVIYRRNCSRSVGYTASSAISLKEDGWISAPTISVSYAENGQSADITLSHGSASAIYYTLDGSAPSAASARYTGPLHVTDTTVVRAIADPGQSYTGSFPLYYQVTIFAFTDVPASSWYAGAVNFAYQKGLFSGTTATTFSPSSTMTRGMFITVLGRLQGLSSSLASWTGTLGITNGNYINVRSSAATSASVVTQIVNSGTYVNVTGSAAGSDGATWYRISYNGNSGYVRCRLGAEGTKTLLYVYSGGFTDLGSTYYTGYAQWAYLQGIMSGTSATTFSPNASITRQDICVLIYRYLTSYKGRTLGTSSDAFSDDAGIAAYARTAVYAMRALGIVNGYSDGSFRPNGTATRAEVATIFRNLYQYLNG